MNIATSLRDADKSWNVMTIACTITDIMRAQPELTLLDIENVFRSIESKITYLVAWPVEQMPQELRPIKLDGTPAKYGLWICINGHTEMLNQLSAFGLTIEQNRAALRDCGFNMMVTA